jgi:hypothetical protein
MRIEPTRARARAPGCVHAGTQALACAPLSENLLIARIARNKSRIPQAFRLV